MYAVRVAQPLKDSPRAVLGEGPIWDERRDILYWVDIMGGKIYSYDALKGKFDVLIKINDYVTCVALTSDPNFLLVTLKDRVALVDISKKVIARILAKIDEPESNRLNDCKVDAAGRLWFGSMDMNERSPSGSLYVLEPNGVVRKVLSGVTISNGIAWSLDNRYMYYIDSPTKKVMVFNYDINNGRLLSKVMDIDLSKYNGVPDGMTMDSQGYLWVAIYGDGRVLRIDAERGIVVDEVKVSVPYTTSCVFGGPAFSTLFITTARNFPRDVERDSDDGKLHFLNLDVGGYALYKYKLI